MRDTNNVFYLEQLLDGEEFDVLSLEEERRLFAEYAATKDDAIKEQIINHNLRLVRKVAMGFLPITNQLTLDDLFQDGISGLIKAIERFDASKGFKFSTYATWWIRQSISRAIAETDNTIRWPVHQKEKLSYVKRQEAQFLFVHGRFPDADELYGLVKHKLSRANFDSLMEALETTYKPLSLDMTPEGLEDATDTIKDRIPDKNQNVEKQAEIRMLTETLENTMAKVLSEREIYVIKRRFGFMGPMGTLQEVGEELGVTRERVRQIEEKALRKLRVNPELRNWRRVDNFDASYDFDR